MPFNYERDMRRIVRPAFEHLTLREIGVARCGALLEQLGQRSHARSKRVKTVMRLVFGLAVRHEIIVKNPIDRVARLHKPKVTPTALTAMEVNANRAAIKVWEYRGAWVWSMDLAGRVVALLERGPLPGVMQDLCLCNAAVSSTRVATIDRGVHPMLQQGPSSALRSWRPSGAPKEDEVAK